jgi:hypothetical protein
MKSLGKLSKKVLKVKVMGVKYQKNQEQEVFKRYRKKNQKI